VEKSGNSHGTGTSAFTHMIPGDHAYAVYRTATERRTTLHDFLKAGIDAGQRVAYLSGELPDESEEWLCGDDAVMHRCVGSGQLLLVGAGGPVHRGPSGEPCVDPGRTLQCLQLMADDAMTDGYPALRLAADGTYLTQGLDPARVVPFERGFTSLIEANRMLALCLYADVALPAAIPGILAAGHHGAPARAGTYSAAGLRITPTSSPPGIRLAGELDRTHLPAFVEALAELAQSSGTILLDMRSLTFIDVAAVTAIADTAKKLDEGRQVVLDSPPSMAGRILAKCWQGIPLPRLAIAADRSRPGLLGTTWTAAMGVASLGTGLPA
jgi:anti-anti-sigma factor